MLKDKNIYIVDSQTPTALLQMRNRTKPYYTQASNFELLVKPNVWSPKFDWSSHFYIEICPDLNNKTVLEVGSGSGVLSVNAAKSGASFVTAVDINPHAVENTLCNFQYHNILNAEAFVSDVFDAVTMKYDVVIWNAPYHGNKPDLSNDMIELGCSDEDYCSINKFLLDVRRYLKPGGYVMFGFSESGDVDRIESLFRKGGLTVSNKLSDFREGYNCMLYILEASHYSKKATYFI